MATVTIRNVPDEVKHVLRVKAAENGRSLEDALRRLLAQEADASGAEASNIGVDEIMRRAAELEADEPTDARFKHFTEKELSDLLCGEFDDLL